MYSDIDEIIVPHLSEFNVSRITAGVIGVFSVNSPVFAIDKN